MRTESTLTGLIIVLISLAGCGGGADRQPAAGEPAVVVNAPEERDLATITLTPQAEARLGIETAAAVYRPVQRTRLAGGELMAVPGRAVVVTAPTAGIVLAPAGAALPSAGARIGRGGVLGRLLPAPAGGDPAGTRDEVARRQAACDLARHRVERAEAMLENRSGSERAVEEARAELLTAELALQAATARLAFLEGGGDPASADLSAALTLSAPVGGVVQRVAAAAGQAVNAAEPLFEIVDVDPLWVRVPVYAGELGSIDTGRDALLSDLRVGAGEPALAVRPVRAPLTADPAAVTADLFYAVPNREFRFRPGQRVSVTLFLAGSEERLTVPYAAVLYDMYGGTWIYTNPEPHTFVRTRVELAYVMGELAVLTRGPTPGTPVVYTGAAELFGTEFGVGK